MENLTENSLQTVFDDHFLATLKISKKIQFWLESAQTFDTTYVHVYVSETNIKMENYLLFNFGKIWPETMYYSTGTLARFLSNFKNL